MTDPPEPAARSRTVAHARLWWAAAVCLAGGLGLLVVVLVGDGAPTSIDTAVRDTTSEWTASATWAVRLAEVYGHITDVATSTVVATVATLLAFAAGLRRISVFIAATALTGVMLAEGIKISIGRARPPGAEAYMSDLDKSFPSGHAMAGVYVYTTVAVVLALLSHSRSQPALTVLARVIFALGILMGISRIVLGVHWATDVLAGWLFASAVLLAYTAGLRPETQVGLEPDDPQSPSPIRDG